MVDKTEDFVVDDLGEKGPEEFFDSSDDDKILSPDELEAISASGTPPSEESDNTEEQPENIDIEDSNEEIVPEEEKNGFLLNKNKKNKKEKKAVDTEKVSRRDPDNISSARTVVIDFLEGTFKKSEAMAYARGFIDNHYAAPKACFVYVMPYEGVYAVEIHDGGDGKPYLPNIIKSLEDDPSACACIQNRRRTLEIKRNEKGVFSSILLPEGIDSTETNIIRVYPSDKTKMRAYSFKGLGFVVGSLSLCLLGFMFLLLTSIACLIAHQRPVKTLPTTKVKNLPILQWEKLLSSYTAELYVEKLTYGEGRWNVAQRKIPFIKQESIAMSDLSKEIKMEVSQGMFLTDEEKDEIRKHLKDEVIKTVKEKQSDLVKEITDTVKEELKQDDLFLEDDSNRSQRDRDYRGPEIRDEFEMDPEMGDEFGMNPEMMDDPMLREEMLRDRMERQRGSFRSGREQREISNPRGMPNIEDLGPIVVE